MTRIKIFAFKIFVLKSLSSKEYRGESLKWVFICLTMYTSRIPFNCCFFLLDYRLKSVDVSAYLT